MKNNIPLLRKAHLRREGLLSSLPLEDIVQIIRDAGSVVSRNYILPRLGDQGMKDAMQSSNGAQLRAAIQEIRRSHVGLRPAEFLLSDSRGYWLTEDAGEVRDFVARQYARGQETIDTGRLVEDQLNAFLAPAADNTEQPQAEPRVRIKQDENETRRHA